MCSCWRCCAWCCLIVLRLWWARWAGVVMSGADTECDNGLPRVVPLDGTARVVLEMFGCIICHSLAWDPQISNCGHMLCSGCVQRLLANATDARPTCPNCRAPVGSESYQSWPSRDLAAKQLMDLTIIMCPLSRKGECKWTGPWTNAQDHIVIACPLRAPPPETPSTPLPTSRPISTSSPAEMRVQVAIAEVAAINSVVDFTEFLETVHRPLPPRSSAPPESICHPASICRSAACWRALFVLIAITVIIVVPVIASLNKVK